MTAAERAQMMGCMLSFVANLSQPATFSAVLHHLMEMFGKREEDIGGDFYTAWFMLIQSGLAATNTYNLDGMVIAAGTTIAPSSNVLSFVLSDFAEVDD